MQNEVKEIKSDHDIVQSTDLGSLIGNFDCGHSTVWKHSTFPATLIFGEINVGSFQKVNIYCFNNFKGFKIIEIAVFDLLKSAKLISCKIMVAN